MSDSIHDIVIKDREKKNQIKFTNIKAIAKEYLTALSIAHEVVVQ